MNELLIAALQNKQKEVQNNPFVQAGGITNQFIPAIASDPNLNSTQRLLGALLTGVGGGIVSGFGRKQAREDLNQFSQALTGLSRDYYGNRSLAPYAQSQDDQIAQLAPILEMQRQENQFSRLQQLQEEERKAQLGAMYGAQKTAWGKGQNLVFGDQGPIQATQIPGYVNPSQIDNSIPENLRPAFGKLLANQTLTEQEANDLAAVGRLDTIKEARQLRQVNEVGDRFGLNRGDRLAEVVMPGYTQITTFKLRPQEASALRAKSSAVYKLESIFNQIANDPNADPDAYFGQEGALADALRQLSFGELRGLAGTGANLTGNEKELVNMQTFSTLNTDPLGAIKRMVQGRDQKEFASNMASLLRKLHDNDLAINYGQVRADKPAEYYDPVVLDRIQTQLNLDGQSYFAMSNNQPGSRNLGLSQGAAQAISPAPVFKPGQRAMKNGKWYVRQANNTWIPEAP